MMDDKEDSRLQFVTRTPSTLLKTVPTGDSFFGETVNIDFPHPEMKYLESGVVHELEVSILDDTGRKLNNHEFPILVVLEIKSL